jgi:hypothetical protein
VAQYTRPYVAADPDDDSDDDSVLSGMGVPSFLRRGSNQGPGRGALPVPAAINAAMAAAGAAGSSGGFTSTMRMSQGEAAQVEPT